MRQADLLHALRNYHLLNPHSDLNKNVLSIVNDTRQIQKDSCFIAIRGENFDGHQAIEEVIDNGATLIIVDQKVSNLEALSQRATIVCVPSTHRAQAVLANAFYNEPSTLMNVIAVTGTNGKTTTSTMISDLLEGLGRRTGLIGTMHYKVGDQYYPAINTTPNSLVLQKLYSEMVEDDINDVVIEASSHALQLGRLSYTDVDCAVYTNLSREHFDFHHTMENYANAKALLFSQLGQKTIQGKTKLAILNEDDEYASVMAQSTSAEILTYSLVNKYATLYADNIQLLDSETKFDMHLKGKTYSVTLPMLGSYNISNYMAAFLVLHYFYEYDIDDILRTTEQNFTGVKGRMEVVETNQDFEVIVDFAHTPDALENVLSELSNVKESRLITVFGHSGGNRDSGARPELGDILFKWNDYIIFTADNPRHEPIRKINQMMIQDHDEKKYCQIDDRKEAIRYALKLAQSGDIILFAGKGGEPYQVIGDKKIPYNEIEYIKTYLNEMND